MARRSAQAVCEHHTAPVPAGVPTGPFNRLKTLEYEVKRWAANTHNKSGGFPCGLCRSREPTGNRGNRKCFRCKKEMECKFELTYEYSFDGWIIAAWRDEHSAHPFHMEELEVLADSGCLTMPKEYREILHLCAMCGDTPTSVLEKLNYKAIQERILPTWTMDFVRNRMAAYKTAKELDVR